MILRLCIKAKLKILSVGRIPKWSLHNYTTSNNTLLSSIPLLLRESPFSFTGCLLEDIIPIPYVYNAILEMKFPFRLVWSGNLGNQQNGSHQCTIAYPTYLTLHTQTHTHTSSCAFRVPPFKIYPFTNFTLSCPLYELDFPLPPFPSHSFHSPLPSLFPSLPLLTHCSH